MGRDFSYATFDITLGYEVNIDKAIKFFRSKIKDLPAEIIAEKGFRLILKD
jgi:hypothetical protein